MDDNKRPFVKGEYIPLPVSDSQPPKRKSHTFVKLSCLAAVLLILHVFVRYAGHRNAQFDGHHASDDTKPRKKHPKMLIGKEAEKLFL